MHGARGERAFLGGQPRHQGGHLGRGPDPAHRNLGDEHVDGLLRHLLEQFGADDGGGDGMYENALGGDFFRQGLGKADHAGLRRGVGHQRRVALLAGDGGDVDDAPVLPGQHQLHRGPADEEDTGQVAGDHLLPVGVAQLPDRVRPPGDARVVDDHVEPVGPGVRRADGAVDVRRHGHVGHEAPRGDAQPLGHPLHLDVAVHQRHARALGEQALGDGQADAARRAGDQRRPSVESHGHS